jgi:hypothetical protein
MDLRNNTTKNLQLNLGGQSRTEYTYPQKMRAGGNTITSGSQNFRIHRAGEENSAQIHF